ncbi:hypothetical protein K470DRAFT_256707 [Piedraia hortae CBS 480.64]|uniref:Uncharacterized protein n=1 Tax=Piedraia hortae CBS 480.64 TaxID=1314780 RepID=A0A6A7C244_9PEZI|nr:hypothetical protein K470DRAFT_256707 [Piedraia hortae CBS 480.64]
MEHVRNELASWWAPHPDVPVASHAPQIGSPAPHTPKLGLEPGQPTVLVFLRHCGCPFAEKTYLNLREVARRHLGVAFIAISHSDERSTTAWLKSLPQVGSETPNVRVVVDARLEIYSAWGLGQAPYAHVLSPASLFEVWRLARDEGIVNRPTDSGSRWQMSGFFAVDKDGIVRWGRPAKRADEIPDFEAAVRALG